MTVMRLSEKYCPWIDKDLKKLMQTRDKLKRAAAKRKSQFLMDSYRQVRNKVNVLNIQLKKQYYTNKISACQGNMKESWKANQSMRSSIRDQSPATLIVSKSLVLKLFIKRYFECNEQSLLLSR